jgi:hypothetical protein
MADRSKWFEHKKQFVEKGRLHPIFLELDKISFVPDPTYAFEPLLIARHAQRMGELVDRCLAIRKDILELEILAVKAETDYDLFNSTSALDQQIDTLRLQIQSKTADQVGFENATATFSPNSTLEKGLTAIAQGRDNALGEDITSSGTIQNLTTQRWQSLHAYQDAYHARYTEPGNAHNFGERANLLLQVLTVLMQEALARATALAAGIQRVYQTQLSGVPTSVTLQSVDQFAVWAMKTIQSLSRAAEQETVSEVVIPLVQPWLPSGQSLITADAFNSAVNSGTDGQPITLSFNLLNNGLLDPQTRLKGIGISFGNAFNIVAGSGIDRNQTSDAFTRLTVTIATPLQLAADGSSYSRPPVLIGNVGLHGAGGGSVVEGNAVENVSPFGSWTVKVHPLIVWKDSSKQTLANPPDSAPMSDLKLSLRLYVPGRFQ